MLYRPALLKKNVNVSPKSPLKEFCILFAGLSTLLLLVFWALGFFVDAAVATISPEMEQTLFAAVSSSSKRHTDLPSEKEAALQSIIHKLEQCLAIPYPVSIHIKESPQVNASVLPGGTIIVMSGLLKKANSENELAFVLAHELGHCLNRDHLKAMGRRIVILALSAMITGTNSDISRLLVPAERVGYTDYSRNQELAADKTALLALNCTYGHVGGATDLFEAMGTDRKRMNAKTFPPISSHPDFRTRIDKLKKISQARGLLVKDVKAMKL